MKILRLSFLVLAALTVTACKKEEPAAVSTAAVEAKQEVKRVAKERLADRLPENVLGYLSIDYADPTYATFAKSKWKEQFAKPSQFFQASSMPTLQLALAGAGVDITSPESVEKFLLEGVVFTGGSGGVTESYGVVIKPKEQSKLNPFFASLKESLKGEGTSTKFSASCDGANLTFAQDGKIGVISSDASLGDSILNGAATKLTAGDQHKRATVNSNGFITGYVNLAKAASTVPLDPSIPVDQSPFEGLGFSVEMKESPQTRLYFSVKDKGSEEYKKLQTLGSKVNEERLRFAPQDSFFVAHMDGGTIRAAEGGAQGMTPPDVKSMIDGIGRLSIALREAPAGTTFLPIPEFIIAIDTANPTALRDQIVKFTEEQLAQQMPGLQFTKKTLGEKEVMVLPTPLGSSLIIAPTADRLFIGTGEAQIAQSLQGKAASTSVVSSSISGDTGAKSLGGVFIDFSKVADLMASAGQMASQSLGGGAAGFDGSELKNLGSLAATATLGEEGVEIVAKLM